MEAFGATWSGDDSGSDGGIGDGVDGDGDDYGSGDGGSVVGEGGDRDAGGVTTIKSLWRPDYSKLRNPISLTYGLVLQCWAHLEIPVYPGGAYW